MNDKTSTTIVDQLVLIGDSWSCGEWKFNKSINRLELSHPGMTEYLPYKVVNLSKENSSNWQILHTMFNYMNQRQDINQNYAVVIFQTDPIRARFAEKFGIDVDSMIKKIDSLENLYISLIEIFYIKLSELSTRFNIPVYIIGGLSDVDKSIFSLYNSNKNIICSSWVKLLHNNHKENVIPLQFESALFVKAKKLGRLDLCDEILETNDRNFIEFTEVVGLDTFGPTLGDFHPNREGHRIMADCIIKYIQNSINVQIT